MGLLNGLSADFTRLVGSTGYAGIFVLTALGTALIPVPSELVLPFAGYLVYQHQLNFWAVVAVATLGSMFGAQLSYELGRVKGRAWLLHIGKYILLNEEDLDRAIAWLDRWERPVVFFSRLVPVMRTYISFPAGMARVPRPVFFIYTLAGSFIWSAFLVWVGYALGPQWNRISAYSRVLDVIVGLALLAGVVWYIRRHRRSR